MLSAYSAGLYARLEEQSGHATGWTACGSLVLATSEARLMSIRCNTDLAGHYDIDCEVIGPAEVARRWPLMDVCDVKGALWIPAVTERPTRRT